MNITTYRNYAHTDCGRFNKQISDLKEQLIQAINSCETEGQMSGCLAFHSEYLGAIEYEKSVRYKEVTERMMKTYFTKRKKQNNVK
jgi:hypothetical protein